MSELVLDGVTDVTEVLGHLRLKTKEIHAGKPLPDRYSRRFYPSRRDVSDMVYREKNKLRNGVSDLSAMDALAAQNPLEIFYRAPEDDVNLLWVFQTEWQRRLLVRYGNTMTFLDGTYKTMKYTLPLYLLVVKSNVGYIPVAVFIVQRETADVIGEALGVIASRNPTWQPEVVMLDCDESEEIAVKSIFPGMYMNGIS